MLRVGLFTDTFIPVVDGVGRVVLSYAEALCALGHQAVVSAPMYNTGYRGGYPFDLIDFNSNKMRLPGTQQYNSGTAAMDPGYRRRMRWAQLDIAHTHSPFGAGTEALRVARARNLPLVGTFHSKYYDDFYRVTKSDAISSIAVKYVVDFFNKCDEVWSVSEATANVLHQYGYKPKIQVMPNGVTMRRADPDAIGEVERTYRLGSDPMLLFVGQLNWKKNIIRTLEAAAIMKIKGERFKLVLAGQGPNDRDIIRKAAELHIDDMLVMTGHVTNSKLLDGLYERATLFVFPSVYDNAPMVVREAAVMGTPSVLVRGSSAADIVKDGQNGLLCEDNSRDLARVILRVLHDDALIRRLGEDARQTIPVPWEQVMARVTERYSLLIDMNRHGCFNKKHSRS